MPLPVTPLSDDELEDWWERFDRAMEASKSVRQRGVHMCRLYESDVEAWRTEMGLPVDGASPIDVCNNALASQVRSDVESLVPKNPRVRVEVLNEWVESGGVKVLGAQVALSIAEAGNLVQRVVRLRAVTKEALLAQRLANVGYGMILFPGGPDVGSVQAIPGPEEGEKESKAFKKWNWTRNSNEVVEQLVPGLEILDFDKVVWDPDARRRGQVNWWGHRMMRPVKELQEEMVPAVGLDGKLVLEGDEPRMEKKYKNTANLADGPLQDAEDDNDALDKVDIDELPPEGYSEVREVHLREPLPSRARKDYLSGFRWLILSLAKDEDGKVVCLRHIEYRTDIGRCAIVPLFGDRKLGKIIGTSVASDFAPGIALSNRVNRAAVRWLLKNKSVRFFDVECVDKQDLEVAEEEGDVLDWVGVRGKGEGRPLQDNFALSPRAEMPQELLIMSDRLMGMVQQNQGSGPNQQGAVAGIRTAAEVNAIQQASDKMRGEDEEVVKEWQEEILRSLMMVMADTLPDSPDPAGWAVRGANGEVVRFQAEDLKLAYTMVIDYASMPRQAEPLKIRQYGDQLKMIMQIPPPMLDALKPLLDLMFLWQGMDAAAAWEQCKQKLFPQNPTEPDTQHVLMLNGHQAKVDPNEDLEGNMVKHLAMAQQASGDPEGNKAWHVPLGQSSSGETVSPYMLLLEHIAEHEDVMKKQHRVMKPMGPAGSAEGGGPGKPPGNAPGSGGDSGRDVQSEEPSSEDLEGAVQAQGTEV